MSHVNPPPAGVRPYRPSLYLPGSLGRYRQYPHVVDTPIPGAGYRAGRGVWGEQPIYLGGYGEQIRAPRTYPYGQYARVPLRGMDGLGSSYWDQYAKMCQGMADEGACLTRAIQHGANVTFSASGLGQTPTPWYQNRWIWAGAGALVLVLGVGSFYALRRNGRARKNRRRVRRNSTSGKSGRRRSSTRMLFPGDRVRFGPPGAKKLLGEVVKVGSPKSKIRQLEAGHGAKVGAVWDVPSAPSYIQNITPFFGGASAVADLPVSASGEYVPKRTVSRAVSRGRS